MRYRQPEGRCPDRGAIIGPGLGEKLLTDESFAPFWEEANLLKAVLFIHPLLNTDPRLKNRMMPNLIGIPWETTVCATDLLLGGMLDKYPNAKVLLAHGGGFLPYQIRRMNKGYEQWSAVSSALQSPPSEYLKRFWYDSVLWNGGSLEYLISSVAKTESYPAQITRSICAIGRRNTRATWVRARCWGIERPDI